jgi:hypothetical protein
MIILEVCSSKSISVHENKRYLMSGLRFKIDVMSELRCNTDEMSELSKMTAMSEFRAN